MLNLNNRISNIITDYLKFQSDYLYKKKQLQELTCNCLKL